MLHLVTLSYKVLVTRRGNGLEPFLGQSRSNPGWISTANRLCILTGAKLGFCGVAVRRAPTANLELNL